MTHLTYNFSGDWVDVSKALRCFSTDTVLKRISKEAISLSKNTENKEALGTRWVEYNPLNTITRVYEKKNSLITVWGLIDLAYYAVLASNDYRGKTMISDDEFYLLVDAVEGLKQKKEQEFLDTVESGSREIYMYLWGFAGEQFKVEEQIKIFDNTGRELYILFESSKRLVDNIINISEIVQEQMGMNWVKVLCALLLGWSCSSVNCKITDTAFSFGDPETLSKEEYLKAISHYSINYKAIRESKLDRQVLYTKPYIITQKNEILGIIPYLNLCLYEHAILWIVRDYYNNLHDQEFTAYFGKCFEKYFEEMLNYNLKAEEYERIPEEKTPRADWKLEIEGYSFLIEQKSSFVRLKVKQQASYLRDIEYFSKETLIKAIEQLDTTETVLGAGQFIKIVLLYDDYLNTEIIEQVFAMEECHVESDDHFWVVTIEEMEILLTLCQRNRALFCSVIEEKNRREINHSNAGKRLMQIFHENNITENGFLKREEIAYYRNLAIEKARSILIQP